MKAQPKQVRYFMKNYEDCYSFKKSKMPVVWCAFQFHDLCHPFLTFHTYGALAGKFRLIIYVYSYD